MTTLHPLVIRRKDIQAIRFIIQDILSCNSKTHYWDHMARRRKKGRQVDSKSITTSLFRPCLSCYITISFFSSTKSLLKMMRASVRQKHQCLNYMRGIIPLFLVNKQYTLLTCSYKAFLSVIRKIPLMEAKNIRISIILIHMAKVLLGGALFFV